MAQLKELQASVGEKNAANEKEAFKQRRAAEELNHLRSAPQKHIGIHKLLLSVMWDVISTMITLYRYHHLFIKIPAQRINLEQH